MRWSLGAVVGVAAAAVLFVVVAVVVIVPRHGGSDARSGGGAGFVPKTAEYYMAHRDEMKARKKECGNQGISPMGESPEARDCNAAEEAERRIFFGGQG